MVDAGALNCPEEMCPMRDGGGAGSTDTEIYPDLAKANLLRMRGDYKQAHDLCLSILKRYPGDVTAHTLLGDICAEQGDLKQASDWYEMALDLAPESHADKKKLEAVRQRISEREAAMTAERLGIETRPSKTKEYAALIIAFVLLVGVVSFLLGDRLRARKTEPQLVTKGVEIEPNVRNEPAKPPIKTEPSAEAPTVLFSSEETALLAQAVQSCFEGSRIGSAALDPRSGVLTLSYATKSGEDEQSIGAKIGISAISVFSKPKALVVRGIRDGAVVFVADVVPETARILRNEAFASLPKERLMTALTSLWPQEASAPPPTTSTSG